MPTRKANARWEGDLKGGKGQIETGTGSFKGPYSFPSRFESGQGTNPEELIAAAHAGCFSMALAHALAEAGHQPEKIETTALVHLEKAEGGFVIPRIELQTHGKVLGIAEEEFRMHADLAKQNCPVSKALAGVEITLQATLN